MSQHELQFIDSADLADEMQLARKDSTAGLGGVVEIRDAETGALLVRRKNIFVLRGRTFLLEKLFNDQVAADSGYIQNLARKINLFRIGSGGTPEGSPFAPIPPSPLDMNLATPIAFRSVHQDDVDTHLTEEEQSIYHEPMVDGVDSTITHYYAKTFEQLTPPLVLNKATNETYRLITLMLSEKDCREQFINELGLCISTDEFGDIELFSRLTFSTEHMTGNKSLLISYYTYA